ncbi:hypothetical protein [Aliiroseovarius sp. PrR006]|uniref:hypothetical protein n=1 Tax=Aliiroseovarius sp. PrR006 TaxID=2706883 RepID=UPI0013D14C01|nr:hypothetical protein [Aliiroseovarius sp. PrR006]NDW53357.1 hypothetical protein [Aliiroseovarius sp. PrR006]
MLLEDKKKFTVYLDQNIVSHLREGEPAKEELSRVLERFQEHGAVFVYSHVHVEECRAFYEPEQYVRVLDKIDGHYIQPTGQQCEAVSNMANGLILCKTDFASKSHALLCHPMALSQYILGWLGELEADELKRELNADIDLWVKELERETLGLFETSLIRQQLSEPLLSLELNKLKQEGLKQKPQTEREWNVRYGRIDNLAPSKVVDFILSEIDGEAARSLADQFPKGTWPNGTYKENGTLTGLLFFLFTQGVGRDPRVKKGSQSQRRKRLQAQFRDCQHIEEAARCDLFLSNDAAAIKLAQAAYDYAGVDTVAKHVLIHLTQ